MKKKKAALYIRVSTNHQIDKDSLPLQRKDLITYAEVILAISDYEIFEDAGYSGKNIERPAYQDMMRRCRNGEFSHILVWKIDRISRNLLDFASMYSELKKLGIVFVSKNEQFDTSAAIGEAMLKIILVFAELERNMTSERVSAVMVDRAKKGLWNGANIPYGYDWNKEAKYPVINEEEAAIVKSIFENYVSMKSLVKVAHFLKDNKIPTKRGGNWTTRTLHQMLKNPFYIGTLRYNYKSSARGKTKPQEEWILKENNHPALIDQALFDKCQSIMSANSSYTDKNGKARVVSHLNIFAGLLRCDDCGRNLKAQIGRERASGIRFSSYHCNTKHERTGNCNNSMNYHDELIGEFVLNYISNILNVKKVIPVVRSPKELEHHLLFGSCFADVVGIAEIDSLYMSLKTNSTRSYGNKPTVSSDVTNAEKIQADIAKKERALERLNKLFLYDDEAMSEAEYIVTKNKLRQELAQLNDKLAETSAPTNNVSDDKFISNASDLILLKFFQSGEYIDFVKLVEIVDKPALREFAVSVIKKITTNNHKITSIEFTNGSVHHFAYK